MRVFGLAFRSLEWSSLVVLGTTILYGIGASSQLWASTLVGRIIDQFTPALHSGIYTDVLHTGLWLVGAYLLHELAYRMGHIGEVISETQIQRGGETILFTDSITKDYLYFADRFGGSITQKIAMVTDALKSMALVVMNDFGESLIFFCSAVYFLSQIYHPLGIALLVWTILFTLGIIPIARKLEQASSAFAEAESRAAGFLTDTYSNIATVKIYGLQPRKLHHVFDQIRAQANASFRMGWWEVLCYHYQGINAVLVASGLVGSAFWLAAHHVITIGQAIGIAGMATIIFDAVWTLGPSIASFLKYYGESKGALEDLSEPARITDQPAAFTQDALLPDRTIVFDDVSFRYHPDRPIIDHFSLTVHEGEKIGLVGLSGAGKTTCVNLLLRFLEPQSGRITIGGRDLRELTQDYLHAHLSHVAQESTLFHTTLAENIAYGSQQEPTSDSIERAATLAYAHDFITALPDGYASAVGERGIKLSGGQRQRVTIARAILKDAPIFVLDEATSALDSDSEIKVQNGLQRLMKGRTVIAVAHRLSTLRFMDRIVVMQNGTITEEGTHEELLAQNGHYAALWAMQSGTMLKEDNPKDTEEEAAEIPEQER